MAENKGTAANRAGTGEEGSGWAHRIAERADRIKYLILALLVIFAAAIAIYSSVRRANAAREAAAENAFYQANIDLMGNPESDAVAVFTRLSKDYAGLPTGGRSLISQFSYAFNTRDFPAAETAVRQFIKDYAKHPMIPKARLSLAQTLIAQDKISDALAILRDLESTGGPGLVPEAKLALAQALELDAESVKDNPTEYRLRLERASNEYNDIVVRSQIIGSTQRIYWPQLIVDSARFALVVIKDRLAGHEHEAPLGLQPAPALPEGPDPVMAIPPPPENGEAEAPAPEAEAEVEVEAPAASE